MKYPAHLVGGLTFGIVANQYVIQNLPVIHNPVIPGLIVSTIFIAGSVIGSLFPDIDHRGSYLGKRLPLLSWITSKTLGHRGGTHSPIIAIALTTLLIWIVAMFCSGTAELFLLTLLIGCLNGAISHIFLDSLTVMGVPLLFPFSSKHYRLARFKTGGWGETFVTIIMFVIIVLCIKNSSFFEKSLASLM